MIMSIHRKKKVTRITPLNSEEVALSQARISEFLSDNSSKDKLGYQRLLAQIPKKHRI